MPSNKECIKINTKNGKVKYGGSKLELPKNLLMYMLEQELSQ
ncbi:hypothetical protein TPELB_24440 [Terrisporobacter petrolearius]|uniref:Uncharacterized protein n=1 Tax=Terrisporobacter petrolearius TaxID=1460447 RepID=A0ABZ3FE64_9FIRM